MFADDNFKFDACNGRKFSKPIENTVGNGEIARIEQFLLFSQRFQQTCTQTRKNQGLFGKGLKNISCLESLTLSQKALVFTCPLYKSFENTVGKG